MPEPSLEYKGVEISEMAGEALVGEDSSSTDIPGRALRQDFHYECKCQAKLSYEFSFDDYIYTLSGGSTLLSEQQDPETIEITRKAAREELLTIIYSIIDRAERR